MNMQNLLERIKREQEFFPAAQRQVAAYIVQNYYQIPFFSITSLAKKIGVSDTTIIKFCNQLGYEKFAEFKKVFSDFVHSELVMFNTISQTTEGEGNSENIFDQVLEGEMGNLKSTMSDPMNRKNLPLLLTKMEKAKSIYITGGRTSGALAGYFASTLRYLGLKVYEITTHMSDYIDRAALIDPDDLVIALSFPRYTSLVVDMMHELHTRGVPIVLITDNGLSPAYPSADLVFHCSITSDSYFPYYTSCMALISTICKAAGVAQKESASKHVHSLEQQLLSRGVFT